MLSALYETVVERRDNPQEGSYTCYLLDTGLDKILKKVGGRAQRPSSPQRTAANPR